MTTVRRRRAAAALDPTELLASVQRWRSAKRAEAEAKANSERLRDEVLMPALQRFGRAHGDTGAHLALDLPEPVDGLARIVRRRNVSLALDLDATEALAESKGVLDQISTVSVTLDGVPAERAAELEQALAAAGLDQFGAVTVRRQVDQDRLHALHQRDRTLITEAELDSLFVETVRYSLVGE